MWQLNMKTRSGFLVDIGAYFRAGFRAKKWGTFQEAIYNMYNMYSIYNMYPFQMTFWAGFGADIGAKFRGKKSY